MEATYPRPPAVAIYRSLSTLRAREHRGTPAKVAALFPDWSTADHLKAAERHRGRALVCRVAWRTTAERACQSAFGRPFDILDYKISGIARDEFAPHYKMRLRRLAFLETAHLDAERLHVRACNTARARQNAGRGK